MKFGWLKTVLFLTILLSAGCVQGQMSDMLRRRLRESLQKIPAQKRNDPHFQAAYRFFLDDQYDSTIVNADRYIRLASADKQLKNYARFFRGSSLMQKGIYADAGKEFATISPSFPLYPSVQSYKANLHLVQGEYESALQLFLQLKQIENLTVYALVESSVDHNIGICYMYLEQFDESEVYLLRALNKQIIDKDTVRIVGSYIDIANLYYTQYLDEQAIPYFQKAYDLAHQTTDFDLLGKATLNMAVVEENRKDLAKSLEYRKEYDRWKDSSNNQEKVWEIAQLEKRHLAADKQREISLLERENAIKSKERNAILLGGVILMLILVFIIYLYLQKVKSNRLIASQREDLDRLNAFKNRLFSIVSHDLRSSVNGLRTSTKQLEDHAPETKDPEMEGLIRQQASMANATFVMLDNLLNWALLQSDQLYFHPEKVALHRIVPQVVLNYQPLLQQKSIALTVDIPTGAKVVCDADSLKIVLRNVLDNAIKFTPENGSIVISTAITETECSLSIADSGSGMSEDQLSRVLEQSSAVSKENDQSGTGLGMRLCTSFIAKNEGRFEMKSKLGVGTTVLILLPKA